MKKIFVFTLCLLVFGFTNSKAQTAPDFTANDCNSLSHTLYSTLDSGKVVIMAWVMPCSSCIGPSLTAYNISQSYATSNPGQVQFYLLDDVGNTTCSTLTGWATNNNIGPNLFSFSSTSLQESIFGSGGMPKIVVLGGPNHAVYFNQNGSAAGNSTNIQNAVNMALSIIAGTNENVTPDVTVNIFPNPAADQLFVSSNDIAIRNFEIIDVMGRIVSANNYKIAGNDVTVDVSGLSNGTYMLRLISDKNTLLKKFVVLH